jgi:hypothetical protein
MPKIGAALCTANAELRARVAEVLQRQLRLTVRLVDSPGELEPPNATPLALIVDAEGLGAMSKVHEGLHPIVLSSEAVHRTIDWMSAYPWLSQVVGIGGPTEATLEQVLPGLVAMLGSDVPPRTMALLGARAHGRRAMLYRSARCEERLDRVSAFAAAQQASPRTAELFRDICGELLSNAFYDAPYEAGLCPAPLARSTESSLPPDRPCEVIYGVVRDSLFLRVRDAYGSLRRERLLQVLARCASQEGHLGIDSSRGGAGLGMWRVFKGASLVAVSVVRGYFTEVLVMVPLKRPQVAGGRSTHLFFREPSGEITAFGFDPEGYERSTRVRVLS